ncbi:unnamed protein product [Protopolystoma xenopodis]|uniref:Uncharacterized protein n=1 Tax=Protopolystoma xenopodis TaxID=117903 RepID=A0A3S5CP97_9PLAT|nr:unnamed protein product [Protopolystoma xenopodis]
MPLACASLDNKSRSAPEAFFFFRSTLPSGSSLPRRAADTAGQRPSRSVSLHPSTPTPAQVIPGPDADLVVYQ